MYRGCSILIKLFLLFTAIVVTVDTSSKACPALIQCLQKLSSAENECESLVGDNNHTTTTFVSSSKSCRDTDDESVIKSKRIQQRQQFIECLKTRQSDSYDFEFDIRRDECEDIVSNYRIDDDSTNQENRTTRDITSLEDGDGPRRHGPHRGPPPFDAFGMGPGHLGFGSGGDGWFKGKGKGRHHGKKRGRDDPKWQCMRKLRSRRRQCHVLSHCCTESEICHLKFQLSPLAQEIGQAQLNMAVKIHDCKKQGGGTQTSSSVNSTFADQSDGNRQNNNIEDNN